MPLILIIAGGALVDGALVAGELVADQLVMCQLVMAGVAIKPKTKTLAGRSG
jgi:hypothetical protein